ncbi:hypothetical protein BJ508DRAFT_369909 [Ascobolus immersus RN42]|uniref:Amino acid transporter transmembrane domain-containing protein n=1 Tax=Ascobolus immersus RN42 TaxID=1160509 RepID=A0A3N4IH55_ASCIM|nr:hypothetical protein BJ508DRAFT_369909 [Ascobolus immersus RN42]
MSYNRISSPRSSTSSSTSGAPSPKPAVATPRSVRFNIDDNTSHSNNNNHNDSWINDEDFLHSDDEFDEPTSGRGYAGRTSGEGRAPLLTSMEAPSVSLANDLTTADLLDTARPKSGMKMAFMNMANSIIGAGIIGQPYAMSQAGLIAGVVLLVMLTFMVDWTINLIVINSKLSGTDSFQATVNKCFGRKGLIAISLAQWAFAFGGMIAFCIIIGDTIPHVIGALFPGIGEIPVLNLLLRRRWAILVFTLSLSYPLSLYRDIAKLAKASTLALISMAVIVVTVLVQGPLMPKELKGEFNHKILTINDGIFQAIGVISFAFVCHHNSLLIYGSLRKPTLDRFAKVTHLSTGISMVMCLLMSVAGFMTFKDKTQGNVLNNFPNDNLMVNIARFCFGFNMITTLPLESFVCREVMEEFFYPDRPFSLLRHVLITTALVFSSMFFSLLTCDLGAVFELIGATSACALAYILPPLCYLRLMKGGGWRRWLAWGVVAFGGVVLGSWGGVLLTDAGVGRG